MATESDEKTCEICGQAAKRTLRGVESCESCRKFYQNNQFRNPNDWNCLSGTKDCNLKENRSCRYCRLHKFLELFEIAKPASTDPNKCTVCGCEAAKSKFYGTICCENCRYFFWKRAGSLEELECSGNKECNVDRRYDVIVCEYCRMKKCLDVGMKCTKPDLGDCKVCGDKAVRKCVCRACEAFYWNIKHRKTSISTEICTLNCDITKESRLKCRYCRYKKCLAAGMTDIQETTDETLEMGSDDESTSTSCGPTKKRQRAATPQYDDPSSSRDDPANRVSKISPPATHSLDMDEVAQAVKIAVAAYISNCSYFNFETKKRIFPLSSTHDDEEQVALLFENIFKEIQNLVTFLKSIPFLASLDLVDLLKKNIIPVLLLWCLPGFESNGFVQPGGEGIPVDLLDMAFDGLCTETIIMATKLKELKLEDSELVLYTLRVLCQSEEFWKDCLWIQVRNSSLMEQLEDLIFDLNDFGKRVMNVLEAHPECTVGCSENINKIISSLKQ